MTRSRVILKIIISSINIATTKKKQTIQLKIFGVCDLLVVRLLIIFCCKSIREAFIRKKRKKYGLLTYKGLGGIPPNQTISVFFQGEKMSLL